MALPRHNPLRRGVLACQRQQHLQKRPSFRVMHEMMREDADRALAALSFALLLRIGAKLYLFDFRMLFAE